MSYFKKSFIILFLIIIVTIAFYYPQRLFEQSPSGHVGTSPFAPPQENDHTFVVDAGLALDADCMYRSGGSIVLYIDVNRFTYCEVYYQPRIGRV